ncbi:MAG TPA: histidine kinase [Kiritimatiellia bacterium]|nr:histidine kinase [Kiritimatiellia bacterium]HRZ13308.1 histidine kinase [Kiritimatiellia bacterium]HSA18757.1 histidine kinase [Kiritimatiellia bacterium]
MFHPGKAASWIVGGSLLLAGVAPAARAGEPVDILVLESFGRDVSPWDSTTAAFKKELVRLSPAPVNFHEVTVGVGGLVNPFGDAALVDYLGDLYSRRKPALAVLMAAPAAAFWGRQGEKMFPATPAVIGGIEHRQLPRIKVGSNTVAVVVDFDIAGRLAAVSEVLPEATNIVVVVGDSLLERFWQAECRRAWAPYTNRFQFTWLSGLPFPEICRRVAALPPRTVIGYGILCVDAAGVSHEKLDALDEIVRVANAPVLGMFEEQLGRGILGGRLFSGEELGLETARVAARVLAGDKPGSLSPPMIRSGPPMFDSRQLRRWKVDERLLPPDSVVRFRQPTLWAQYRWIIAGTLTILLLQTATIAGLLVQRVWRRRAEKAAREVSGRLITAQEEERRRIARDLHDDLSQRLALLSVELEMAGQSSGPDPAAPGDALGEMAAQVQEISADVHKLSYQLHPAKLDQLGLVTTARTLCHELSVQSGLGIGFSHQNVPRDLPAEVALCVYRVLQESLGNAIRHSGATGVSAALRMEEGFIRLEVSDNGKGFDSGRARREGGLGLLSMEERARLVRGRLDIHSRPGHGARVELSVPVAAEEEGGA